MCDKVRAKIGRPLWLTMVLIIVVGGIVMNIFFFYLVTWRHLMSGVSIENVIINALWLFSGALLGLCGYMLGGGAAWLARMSRPQVGMVFDSRTKEI